MGRKRKKWKKRKKWATIELTGWNVEEYTEALSIGRAELLEAFRWDQLSPSCSSVFNRSATSSSLSLIPITISIKSTVTSLCLPIYVFIFVVHYDLSLCVCRLFRMQRSLLRPLLTRRGFSTRSSEKIVASVLFERLPVVIPKIDPVVYAFQEFS